MVFIKTNIQINKKTNRMDIQPQLGQRGLSTFGLWRH